MNRKAFLSWTALIIFCVSVSQVLLSFAAYSPSTTIAASGNIKDYAVELDIRKHLVAYGLSSPVSEERIQHMAKFEVLITSFRIGPDVARIKTLNANIVILGYKDIMGIQPTDPDYPEVDAHDDWFLHDLNGNRLVHKSYGWEALDVGKAGWREHYANYVKEIFAEYSFDGVFADDVWDFFIYKYKWTVPPSDIAAEIGERWHNDMLEMVRFVKESIGEKLLIVNTSNDGDYVDACDGKMEEGFVHPSWYAFDEFHDDYIDRESINSVENICQRGKYVLAHSGFEELGSNKTFVESHPEIVHKMLMYCFSSYLLAINGSKASFGFGNIWNLDGSRGYYLEFDLAKQLGGPISGYYPFNSVYARDFENGKVLVNPTTSSYNVLLDQDYKTLDGQTVSSVTLDDHTGVILLKG